MTDYRRAMLVILAMGGVTLATRLLPALIFGRGEKIPGYIAYLGKTVPYTAMGLLIVYCLRDVSPLEAPHGAPEFLALALVSVTYLWKRNSIFSVVVGTAFYIFVSTLSQG